ncbi:adenosylmethionine--8-amino-7-oxononanoate transaminase [Corynebacterium uropygiale]|uniref:Adenosylmethionine-8-amino-7-oxononanoate aminotransferase n=1 Tax=Corynebacterium uropygiale TaxID=1775911 RepID=A0A9X1QSY8_9CORY|nr:adenosylmethionine--8-amino-7-oxononanoate transaminase [Corynebacterium uropygiale]MCF4007660.1 adenosylmethionine--8-amino-7-oxononanoate transaminase [Corynebacterium uropygiale]
MKDVNTEELLRLDARHVWHPYGPLPSRVPSLPVASAKGTRLRLRDGRELIDGMSSWWAVAHGHSHPELVDAATRQARTMSHVMFGGLTHEPAVALAQDLVELTPDPLDCVFFSDSGSISVEVAIKLALQYARATGHPERTRIMTWRGGYHGDTHWPMSVCDPEGGMHSLWAGALTPQVFAPRPPDRGAGEEQIAAYLREVESLLTDEVAAFIIEPVVQGAGGMRFHDEATVRGIRDICRRHGRLFIADEIATGFGRTGVLFTTGADAAAATPDILCVGKALTGGFCTLAATLTSTEIARTVSEAHGGIMHGPTFMGNPLACAVGHAAMGIIRRGEWRRQIPRIEAQLRAGLAPLRADERVADVRVLGAIGVVEMRCPVDMPRATRACVDAGVWLRPFGKLVYTMPMFPSSEEEITTICSAMSAIVEAQS